MAVGGCGISGSLQVEDGIHVVNDHGQLVVDVQNFGLLTAITYGSRGREDPPPLGGGMNRTP